MKKFLAILLIALVACAHVEETANEITEFEDPTLEFLGFLIPVFKAIGTFFVKKLAFGKIAHFATKAFSVGKKIFSGVKTIARGAGKLISKGRTFVTNTLGKFKGTKLFNKAHTIYQKFTQSKLYAKGKAIYDKVKPIYDKVKKAYDTGKQIYDNVKGVVDYIQEKKEMERMQKEYEELERQYAEQAKKEEEELKREEEALDREEKKLNIKK